jgi:hypothetical protein
MQTNRRGFLGIFGAAAVAAPSVNFNEVMTAPIGLASSGFPHDAMEQVKAGDSNVSWAKKAMKALIGKTPYQKARERQRYEVYQWDVNVVALRSVSMPTRIRMTRDRNYERAERREQDYLEGVINGLW